MPPVEFRRLSARMQLIGYRFDVDEVIFDDVLNDDRWRMRSPRGDASR